MSGLQRGQIVKSVPNEAYEEVYAKAVEAIHYDEKVALPLLEHEVNDAREASRNGLTLDTISSAAVETAVILSNLGSAALGSFPLAPIQIFEMRYAQKLAEKAGIVKPSKPNLVVHSGSGSRAPEIWGSMEYPDETGTFPDMRTRMKSKGATIFGELPPNFHCAEPHPDTATQLFVDNYQDVLPPFKAESHASLFGLNNGGLLLSDDSHQDIMAAYRPRSIDKLVVLRFDPDSLIEQGEIKISMDSPDLADQVVEATRTLTKLLRLIKPGGHALLTVGSGNDENETAARRSIISGLRELLAGRKIPYVEFFNPFAQLINRHATDFVEGERVDALNDLFPMASVQGLVVPFSFRLDSLAEEVNRNGILSGPSPTPRGRLSKGIGTMPATGWVMNRIQAGIIYTMDHPLRGSGMDGEGMIREV